MVERVWRQIDSGPRPTTPDDARQSSSRIARIFVSSTFVDMHSEREVLVKRVFPALRQRVEPYGVMVTEVDLRWGVPKDVQGTDTIRICMEELDKCITSTPSHQPFFVSLLGER